MSGEVLFMPYATQLPVALWGYNFLHKMGFYIHFLAEKLRAPSGSMTCPLKQERTCDLFMPPKLML